ARRPEEEHEGPAEEDPGREREPDGPLVVADEERDRRDREPRDHGREHEEDDRGLHGDRDRRAGARVEEVLGVEAHRLAAPEEERQEERERTKPPLHALDSTRRRALRTGRRRRRT